MKHSTDNTGLHVKVGTLEETVVKQGAEITAIKQVVEDNTKALEKLSSTLDSMAPTMVAIQDLVKGASVFQKIIIWVAAALAGIATITQVLK